MPEEIACHRLSFPAFGGWCGARIFGFLASFMPLPFEIRETSEGIVLLILVAPGASRERIIGVHDSRLKIAVNAAPERGKANKAILSFLAKTLGLARNRLSIVGGESQRRKEILVHAATYEELTEKLSFLESNTES